MADTENQKKDNRHSSKIDFLEDDPKEMTFERRFALKFMDKPWYNPMSAKNDDDDDDKKEEEEKEKNGVPSDDVPNKADDFEADIFLEKPCLKKGWAFFEHQILSRYIVPEEGCENEYDMAVPGEDVHPTRLYDWFWTPRHQLGDFGIGVGLYFTSLRYFILMTIVCGIINIPNIFYFSSDAYDPLSAIDAGTFQYGSAVCGSFGFVPCPDCQCESAEDYNRTGYFTVGDERHFVSCLYGTNADGEDLTFSLRTDCDGTKWQLACINFITVIFVLVCLLMLGRHQKREQIKFDENEQTARDYSIVILNPPEDAKDPEEWRRFFHENFDGAQARIVTCVLANGELLKTLAKRRDLIRDIYGIRPGKKLDRKDLFQAVKAIERDGEKSELPQLYSRLLELEEKVEELSRLDYPVKKVFVTFETEENQRHVLKTLSAKFTKSQRNDSSGNENDHMFRKKAILHVREPEEPDDIRWLEVGTPHWKRRIQNTLALMFTIAGCAIGIVFMLLARSGTISGRNIPAITFAVGYVLDLVAPKIDEIVSHPTETGKQLSLYNRRVVNLLFTFAIAPLLTTAFSWTIADTFADTPGLIATVSRLFFLGQTVFPLIFALQPFGRFLRHIVAPRQKTQDSMNLVFRGGAWDLGEQYSQTITMLACFLFYSAIYPVGFFWCALYLIMQYVIGKHNLLRGWTTRSGTVIAFANRNFFFPIIVALMAVFSSYFWTGFPYDMLCEDGPVDERYVGFHNLTWNMTYWGKGVLNTTIPVESSDYQYRNCNQNFLFNFPDVTFPFVPSMANGDDLDPYAYMSEDQIITTTYFGWSALVILVLCILKFLWGWYKLFAYVKYGKVHKTVGDSQGIPYSKVKSIRAYIPEVMSQSFAYPLIACNIDDIDEALFHFKDLDRSHKYYDLSVDLKRILDVAPIENETDKTTANPACLSIVKCWEPNTED